MKCQWFLKCKNEATVYVPHPILKKVPSCDRCARFAEEDPEKLEKVEERNVRNQNL